MKRYKNNKHRRDDIHKPIVEKLREIKLEYIDISQTDWGMGDLIVAYKGHNYFIELKSSTKSSLTEKEKEKQESWSGEKPIIVYSFEGLLEAIKYENKNQNRD